MKIKKFFCVMSLVLVLLIFLPILPIYASSSEKVDNSNDTVNSLESYCYLDFDSIVSNEDTFVCNVLYNYKEIPNILYNGNISYEIIEKTSEFVTIRLFLPEDKEGVLYLEFEFSSETKNLFVYSSKGENNEYGVSSVSLDVAKRLVNNLDKQEYMDNDELPASYVPLTQYNSNRKIQTKSYVGYGRVYGQLKWTDDKNIVHPLVGIKVKLTFLDSYYNGAYQYTDSNGNFDIAFNNVVGNSDFECTLHIYTENQYAKVKDSYNTLYEYVEVLSMNNNSTYQFNYTFDRFYIAYNGEGNTIPPNYLNGAIQVFEAMYNYSNYAVSLSGDTSLPQCVVFYPVARIKDKENPEEYVPLTYCFYDNENRIYLCSESNKKNKICNCRIDGCNCSTGDQCNCANGMCDCPSDVSCLAPYVSSSWDVIGHEYGHHLQKKFFQQLIGGSHYSDVNDIFAYMKNKKYTNSITDKELFDAKYGGCKLCLKEAWPTFFAISAQQSFSDDIKSVPTVGDHYYQSYKGFYEDLTLFSNSYYYSEKPMCNGESDELIVMSFLYRLWNDLLIDDVDLWNVMRKNPVNFSEFIHHLLLETNISTYDLGNLLSSFGIAPYSIDLIQNGTNHLLSFNKGNENITFGETKYQFNNNEFLIEFYDDNDNFIISKHYDLGQNINQNTESDEFSCTIESFNWDRILDIPTLGYYVKITAYAKRTYTITDQTISCVTGPYVAYKRFLKPTNYNIELNNSRYYEKTVTIPTGSSFVFNISDTIGGYRLFQTFGNLNVEMQLYNLSGILLASSINDGFSNNPLIYYNINGNTTYVLNINLCDPNDTGLVKLSIIPCTGDLDSNSTIIETESDIYYHNSNSVYSTYVPQYESTVIRWKPLTTGYYRIGLGSGIDSYLYVINPESPNILIGDVDYNDDFYYDEDNDLYYEDSTLYGYYESNKTYLIVISKFDPSVAGTNISIGFTYLHS